MDRPLRSNIARLRTRPSHVMSRTLSIRFITPLPDRPTCSVRGADQTMKLLSHRVFRSLRGIRFVAFLLLIPAVYAADETGARKAAAPDFHPGPEYADALRMHQGIPASNGRRTAGSGLPGMAADWARITTTM